jgi:transposase
VISVISDGLSVSQAAGKVGVSRQTLHSWLARYEASSAYTSRTALLTKRRAVRSTNHLVTRRA